MKLPNGTQTRLGMTAGAAGQYFVFLAVPPHEPGMHQLDLLRQKGVVSARLTHDAGIAWPRPQGQRMAEMVLGSCGHVVLEFETLEDAMAAHRRVLAELAMAGSQ